MRYCVLPCTGSMQTRWRALSHSSRHRRGKPLLSTRLQPESNRTRSSPLERAAASIQQRPERPPRRAATGAERTCSGGDELQRSRVQTPVQRTETDQACEIESAHRFWPSEHSGIESARASDLPSRGASTAALCTHRTIAETISALQPSQTLRSHDARKNQETIASQRSATCADHSAMLH